MTGLFPSLDRRNCLQNRVWIPSTVASDFGNTLDFTRDWDLPRISMSIPSRSSALDFARRVISAIVSKQACYQLPLNPRTHQLPQASAHAQSIGAIFEISGVDFFGIQYLRAMKSQISQLLRQFGWMKK